MTKDEFIFKCKRLGCQLKIETTKYKFTQYDCIYAIKKQKLIGHYSPTQGGKILNNGKGINFDIDKRTFVFCKTSKIGNTHLTTLI